MAMTMKGQVALPADRQTVWAKLNDPEVLKDLHSWLPELGKDQAVAKVKVGPVSATFKGKVTLSEIDAPNGYRISGEDRAASQDSPRVGRE